MGVKISRAYPELPASIEKGKLTISIFPDVQVTCAVDSPYDFPISTSARIPNNAFGYFVNGDKSCYLFKDGTAHIIRNTDNLVLRPFKFVVPDALLGEHVKLVGCYRRNYLINPVYLDLDIPSLVFACNSDRTVCIQRFKCIRSLPVNIDGLKAMAYGKQLSHDSRDNEVFLVANNKPLNWRDYFEVC